MVKDYWGLWFVVVILLCPYLLLKATQVLPIPDGDSIAFYPVYISIANGDGFEHPFYYPSSDPIAVDAGPYPFKSHGWLSPFVVGNLAGLFGGEIGDVVFVEILLALFGLLAFFYCLSRSGLKNKWLGLMCGAVVFTSLDARFGRPDLLASVFLLIWLAFGINWRESLLENRFMPICGCFLGLIAITQPAAAVLSSLMFLLLLVVVRPSTSIFQLLRLWVLSNTCALGLALGLTMSFYGYPASEWIEGILHTATLIADRDPHNEWLKYYILSPWEIGHGFLLLLAGGCVLASIRINDGVAWFMFLLIISWSWYMGLRIPSTSYNLLMFVPVLLAIAVLFAWDARVQNQTLKTVTYVVMLIVAPFSLVPMGVVAHSYIVGLERTKAIAALEKHVITYQRKMVVPTNLFVGAFSSRALPYISLGNPVCENKGTDIVLTQANTGLVSPVCPLGSMIFKNHFSSTYFSVFGISKNVVPKGYNYTICTCGSQH